MRAVVNNSFIEIAQIKSQIGEIYDHLGLNEPPQPPLDFDWYGWWDLPIEEFPTKIAGLRVGYGVVAYDVPLITFKRKHNEDGELIFYDMKPFESLELRETSNSGNIASLRMIAKMGKILPLYALGNEYELNEHPWFDGDKTVRPFKGDGGNDVFLVLKEGIYDGILAWQNPALRGVEIGIYSRDITRIYNPTNPT